MGARIRGKDWRQTPLGPPAQWPNSLKTAVRIILTSRQPMFVWWGPQLINLYNDAYKSIVGGKHPQALGQPAAEVWREIWDEAGPRAAYAIERNEGTYDEALLLIMERNGYREETYYTFSYSPIPNDDGSIGGIICANSEDTSRIIGERQLRVLQALAAQSNSAQTFGEACERAALALGENAGDAPFALIYLFDARSRVFELAGAAGIGADHPAAPARIAAGDASPWPLMEVLDSHAHQVVGPLQEHFQQLPRGPWPEPPSHAVVVPIGTSGESGQAAVLVAGLNRFRLFDASYQRFIGLVAAQISASIASAQAYERERQRAETLAELDRAKTAFFSNVSHELRTPLTLMLGPLDDLLGNSLLPAALHDEVRLVRRNGERLLKLVNALLDFSRIEAGRVRAVFEPVDLCQLTADIASNFRAVVERAGLSFRVDCGPIDETASLDPDMWERIILNLLSNAFKHTFEGGIEVTLKAQHGMATLQVRDTGEGIAADELPRIFNRFHRVDGARSRTHEGTGIGLALVQELVKLHGGRIEVDSEPGRGTVFSVSIPLQQQAPLDARPATDRAGGRHGAYVEEAASWLGEGAAPRNALLALPALPHAGPRPRVLVADDNADMRDYISRLLAERYDVTAVADGDAALQAAMQAPPDVLITDVMMPKLDGFGLLKALRAEGKTLSTPVIMLSARAGEEARVEGLSAGADDYLVKPFHARELRARVDSILALSRQRLESRTREAELQAETIAVLESIDEGFAALDSEYRFTYVNAQAERLNSVKRSELLGRVHWDVYPDTLGTALERHFRAAMEERVAQHFESLYEPWQRWFDLDVYPSRNGGISIYYRDVTERRRVMAELEESDRRKDEFLATLAHELRNPLAPLRNGLQILQLAGERGNNEMATQARAIMERQLQHMVRLVDDLLDVSRISRNKLELERRDLDIATVIRSAVETSQPLIDAKRQQLTVTVPLGETIISGDHVRLAQVFANLLNNASKYTPANGHISLAAARTGDSVMISVSDDGNGIPPDMLPRIFEMFTQVPQSAGQSQGGLGIGLTLVRRLTELHGGTVTAHSDGQGLGSRFVVQLPLQQPSIAPDEGLPPATPVSTRLRILIADDNEDAASSLAVMLELSGHDTVVANDGEQAVSLAREAQPDVMLLDIGMPRMDGYEACRQLRALSWPRPPMIVALTGWGQAQDRQRSAAAGFDAHLVKPLDVDELNRLLREAASAGAATVGET
ncbi:ATP-binding protein [Uliginosibacterium sp. H1]|uniref:ATP-binding protein n=1 Tax=Uliginosibacterium sp. H1 TaxID=3114757 RepID=UPI002E194F96|nr:ATP-binding protein [Uliginosibacterium sp. H1]